MLKRIMCLLRTDGTLTDLRSTMHRLSHVSAVRRSSRPDDQPPVYSLVSLQVSIRYNHIHGDRKFCLFAGHGSDCSARACALPRQQRVLPARWSYGGTPTSIIRVQ